MFVSRLLHWRKLHYPVNLFCVSYDDKYLPSQQEKKHLTTLSRFSGVVMEPGMVKPVVYQYM